MTSAPNPRPRSSGNELTFISTTAGRSRYLMVSLHPQDSLRFWGVTIFLASAKRPNKWSACPAYRSAPAHESCPHHPHRHSHTVSGKHYAHLVTDGYFEAVAGGNDGQDKMVRQTERAGTELGGIDRNAEDAMCVISGNSSQFQPSPMGDKGLEPPTFRV